MSSPPASADVLCCPHCGHAVRRVRRLNADRALHAARRSRRYRCLDDACGWTGLLQAPEHQRSSRSSSSAKAAEPSRWATLLQVLRSLMMVVGVPTAMLAMTGVGLMLDHGASAATAPGESHDGRPMRARPLLVSSPVAAAAPEHAAAETPLTIRQGCAWGRPGRNPYQGTTEQALRAARLPAEVVREISRQRSAGEASDRLTISRRTIRAQRDGREFDPRSFAMSFGHTVCLKSRVNFAPGHVELASLYEARDTAGRAYAVMVPDVCGNVSVLGAKGQRGPLASLAAALGEPGLPVAFLDDALDGVAGAQRLATLGMSGTVLQVPEPGTLGCVLTGLAALAAWRRRG